MSLKNFIIYLQQLITMLDPKNEYSVALAKSALSSTIALVRASGKADALTVRAMVHAEDEFRYLVEHAKDFAGVPGYFKENEQKRQRLEMMLIPHC